MILSLRQSLQDLSVERAIDVVDCMGAVAWVLEISISMGDRTHEALISTNSKPFTNRADLFKLCTRR